MFIELSGKNRDAKITVSSWNTIQEIAREFGWVPEYDSPPKKPRWSWAEPWLMTDNSSRGLARALYAAIRAIENDSLSEPLVELVTRVGVGHLRDFADLAFEGPVGTEGTLDCNDFT